MENVTVLSVVSHLDENGFVDYGEQSNEDGDVVRFQCAVGGLPILDEDGGYADSTEVAELLRNRFGKIVEKGRDEISRRAALAAALETPGDLTPEELRQAHDEIIEILLGSDNAVD